jgi:hypothetical protein
MIFEIKQRGNKMLINKIRDMILTRYRKKRHKSYIAMENYCNRIESCSWDKMNPFKKLGMLDQRKTEESYKEALRFA